MPIYIYILCNTTYFVTFPKVAIVRCSRKYLLLKCGRQIRVEFLEMLEVAIFSQGFARVNGQLFKTILQTYSEYAFLVVRFNIFCPTNSQWEVHMRCRRTLQKLSMMKLILQLICIVSSNPQPTPVTSFPQVSHLCPIPPGRTTCKTHLLQTHQKQP